MTAIHNRCQTKRQMHSNFCTFKFCVCLILYTRSFTKLHLKNHCVLGIILNPRFKLKGFSTPRIAAHARMSVRVILAAYNKKQRMISHNQSVVEKRKQALHYGALLMS